jgi:hypothetical protein
MINLDTCKIIVYGFKPENGHYHTHSHIHEGFFRAAKFMRPGSKWMDQSDTLTTEDLTNTLFITEHNPAKNIPISDECFYVVHGMNDNQRCREYFAGTKKRLSWNVYHDYSHVYGTQGNPVNDYKIGVPLTDCVWIGEEVPLYPNEYHMDFRWATDLLPHEIQALKPDRILGIGNHQSDPDTPARNRADASKTIWYVGTQWWVNQRELNQFAKACAEDGADFKPTGAGQNGVITVEDNIRLMRESFFAPAISGSHHLTEGYVPCRIFKNISYGMYGVTNNLRAHQVLGNMCIYHPDPYKLYFEARDRLSTMKVETLHALMDMVAEKHTYVNRINSVIKAARMLL